MPAAVQRTMPPGHRRRKAIGQRRRLEDEGDDEGGPDAYDVDDDSLSDGSLISDDNDPANDSDTSNLDDVSPAADSKAARNGAAKASRRGNHLSPPTPAIAAESHPRIKATKSDTDIARNGMGVVDDTDQPDDEIMDFEEAEAEAAAAAAAAEQPKPTDALIVSSSSASKPQTQTEVTFDRRRREHEEYRRKRDEDPAFVPNRGAFFMHDHRHPGPAANGFRPFARRGRGGRGSIGGPYAPTPMHHPVDPLTTGQWTHDMHETVVDPLPPRPARRVDNVPPPNGNGYIPTCPNSDTKINREMSCEKVIARVTITVFLPGMESPKTFPSVTQKQYTKLPDHRPPLRRDKPARIFLPGMPEARHIFPATDRSFIFIPRAMRPNQQRGRGKPRGGFGSIGGFSRRTSVFGGSIYGGSIYSPSIAMSRRSSIAPEIVGRDYLLSPTGSTISRPPMPVETSRPVVRLPPQPQGAPVPAAQASSAETSISDLPQPQTHPLPQKPTFDSHPTSIPMHQPRPQKTVSVENIESPTLVQNPEPYQQAFHQQVPVQVSNGYDHSRQPSYPSTGTPLSQIPERAIHAAPFQPNFNQPGYYSHQPSYPMMSPQQQSYYYPPQPYGGPSPSAAPFVPGSQQAQGPGYNPPPEAGVPLQNTQPNTQTTPGSNMVATEMNGMVYYYDQSHMAPPMGYPPYPGPQGYPGPPAMPMGGPPPGPNPEGYYYQQQQGPGMAYYPQ